MHAREILRFAKNDDNAHFAQDDIREHKPYSFTVGRGLAPAVVYASTCFGRFVGAIHESPVNAWSYNLHENIFVIVRLLPPLTRSPSLSEGGFYVACTVVL